jgi:hypothetical protein
MRMSEQRRMGPVKTGVWAVSQTIIGGSIACFVGLVVFGIIGTDCLSGAERPTAGVFFGTSVILALASLRIPSFRFGFLAFALVLVALGVYALAAGLVVKDCST